MPDVFISYSRQNLEFVYQLVAALEKNGKAPWFDQLKEPLSGIAAGAPWWEQIKSGIENADNFLFVITPNSISSPYCHAEVNYAREHGKRLVPVLYCGWIGEGETRKAIDTSIEAIPDYEEIPNTVTAGILNLKKLVRANWLAISEIQYVVFASSLPFEQSLEQLIQALDLDLAWVRMHSQLVQAAKLWEANNFDDDYLWGANRLKPVYEMIERRKPKLDILVQNFITSEQERLLNELQDPRTSHKRRYNIGDRLSIIGDPRSGIGLDPDRVPQIDWLPVKSGGKITIGKESFVVVPFYIAKYPITNDQFRAFADNPSIYDDDHWWIRIPEVYRKQKLDIPPNQGGNFPRSTISWYQAIAFTRWLNALYREQNLYPKPLIAISELTNLIQQIFSERKRTRFDTWCIRLPTEWEWQWAAQAGDESRDYPWGSYDETPRLNTTEAGIGDLSMAVGMYPHSAAACGALDMAGNLWEWCLNEYDEVSQISYSSDRTKVLRGGAFNYYYNRASASFRFNSRPSAIGRNNGFRLVVGLNY